MALKILSLIACNLFTLDINLPGQNGYSVCASVRQFSDVPILFITGRNTTMDELQALTLGGDNYSPPHNLSKEAFTCGSIFLLTGRLALFFRIIELFAICRMKSVFTKQALLTMKIKRPSLTASKMSRNGRFICWFPWCIKFSISDQL